MAALKEAPAPAVRCSKPLGLKTCNPIPPGLPSPKDAAESASPTSPTLSHTASDDSTIADMPPGGRPRHVPPKREADFSSLLSPQEKSDLTSLVARTTDIMQKTFTHVYDSAGLVDDAPPVRNKFWSGLPAHLRDFSITKPPPPVETQPQNLKKRTKGKTSRSQKENGNMPRDNRNNTGAALQPANPSNLNIQRAPEQENDKTIGPYLQELKKEAMLHFKKWQTAVHKRVGDISVKRAGDANFNSTIPNNRRGRNRPTGVTTPSIESDPVLMQLYPPIPSTLCYWPLEKRLLVLHALLLLLLSLEHYSAYTRVLLLHITSSLNLPLRVLVDDEVRVAKAIAWMAKDINPEELIQKRIEECAGKPSRRWRHGLANMAGTSSFGIPGHLAPPLVAAGIGSVNGGFGLGPTASAGILGSMGESAFVVGALLGIYNARTSVKLMEQYTKEIQDFAFVPLRGSIGEDGEIGKIEPDARRLRVVLTISGWLADESDVTNPWRALGQANEVYAVRWEVDSLSKMVFTSMTESLWPLGLLKINKIIDNPWSVGMVRADKAGALLADAIMNKAHGERGVTLIGYSLGARAIYVCLMVLAERRAFGLVENAVMMGTPAPSEARVWCTMRSVVSGRLVNVFSENDYLLGFLYRTSSIQFGVAGLQRIEGIDGVENVDVSAKVSGHLRYQYLAGSILKHINWEDINQEQVSRDEAAMVAAEERVREREKKRDAVERGIVVIEKAKEAAKNDPGIIRTRMRKKNKR
ncbi:unnamed protein product [Sordaria macrospora k-hell]|uniref:WGS project CABT00000000 data, contig 2.3 n=1 Tax=Sordaria macrospora (strain ATCC MYA-333 / DSM 997 / K(L3346) / K-hell) TaxID=771870 RepID=F7VPF9_SORMK|nr:uncharacterized protein SMAC_02393 [Sordaria macrospora k-hell]KAH7626952.1 hypothetical protein B0T09DRAFT_391350 [Sordaria sp. MPI-SDFR-AT-0083]CCC07387.1 unnamed protein product [Sordaria macrospora k-hell]